MSREILEAMSALAREKGIEEEKLMVALEDALLSAYKKQPDSAKYARVEVDRETADFRVIELLIPERLEAQLIVETARGRRTHRGTLLDADDTSIRLSLDEDVVEIAFSAIRRANTFEEVGAQG